METCRHLLTRFRVVLLLVSLLLIEGASLFFFSSDISLSRLTPLRISEIDGPRIDEVAAVTYQEAEVFIPEEIWWFLLLAYGALLVFNFAYTFERANSPQWFWEVMYTLCVLLGWAVLDPVGTERWFPLMILKEGLILFTLYLYLLEKRLAVKILQR